MTNSLTRRVFVAALCTLPLAACGKSEPGAPATGTPAACGPRPQDRDDCEGVDQSGVPLRADRRRGGGEGAVGEAQRPDRDRLADAAGRGRPGAGAAHRPGGQRGGECDPDLVLGRRESHRCDQRRRAARRSGDDVRQRRAAVAALRVLRRGRREDRPGGDGRARRADGEEGHDRDPRRQPERARTCAGGSTASSRPRPRVIPTSPSPARSTTSKPRRTRRPK